MQPTTSFNPVGDWLPSRWNALRHGESAGKSDKKRLPLRDLMFLFSVLFSLYGLIITRPVGFF